jgi:hypothetical protein
MRFLKKKRLFWQLNAFMYFNVFYRLPVQAFVLEPTTFIHCFCLPFAIQMLIYPLKI